LFSTSAIAQISTTDSGAVRISLEEFRHIIRVNIEKTYQDSVLSLREEEVRTFGRLVADKDSSIVYLRKNAEFLERELDAVRPSWVNRFETGLIAGIIVSVTVVLLTK